MASKPDYYDILGVSKGTPSSEIKKAYRKQALQWHPDKHKDNKEAAEKRFKEINEAYQILSDDQKRKAYDQFGHAAFSPGGVAGAGVPRGQTGQSGPFTYTYTSSGGGAPFAGFDFGDPFEIFDTFFGGRGGQNPFVVAQKPRYGITIEFMEAIKGVEREVSIEGKKRKIKIPAGVDDGSRINFNDFILSINVKPHELFERDGADILMRLDIPFSMAVFGGEVKIPTIDGDVKVKIRKGTRSSTMMRLRGKGIPRLRGRGIISNIAGRGDQYIRINVAVPEKLTKSQTALLKKLQKEKL